jgi:DNA-binding MarR family transcriptional regulator
MKLSDVSKIDRRFTRKKLQPRLGEPSGNLDALDRRIIECLYETPGLSVAAVHRCVNRTIKRLPYTIQQVRYRIGSLEKFGYIRTVRSNATRGIERRCYLSDVAESKRAG